MKTWSTITEGEVRRLLAFCGLPFEPATLSFYANERAVRNRHAQQVRQPIFREGIDQCITTSPGCNRCATRWGRCSPHIRMRHSSKYAANVAYIGLREAGTQ